MAQALSKMLCVGDEEEIRTVAQLALDAVGGFTLKELPGIFRSAEVRAILGRAHG